MEKGCSRLSLDLEIGTSRSLASRLPYNPDRDQGGPAARLTQRGVTACHAFVFCARQARAVRYREMIPGVGMSGRPNPCWYVR